MGPHKRSTNVSHKLMAEDVIPDNSELSFTQFSFYICTNMATMVLVQKLSKQWRDFYGKFLSCIKRLK
jgi:hypothetical protein